MTVRDSDRAARFDLIWLLAFGIASSAYCVATARQIGVTYDEPVYLQFGLKFWHEGTHRQLLRMGTMPLPTAVNAFPLAVAEWVSGERWDFDADFGRMVVIARHANLVFWWLLLSLGMQLARDLGGSWAGRLAVATLACEPNLLAHASLATTDIAATACLLGFVIAYLRGRDSTWSARVGKPAAWYGIALCAKASALAFAPLAMMVIELVRHGLRIPIKPFIRDGLVIGGIGMAIALVACGTDFLPDPSFVQWAKSLPEGPTRSAWIWIAKHTRIFSNAGEALAWQVKHNLRGHGQYLLGQSSAEPFWYYFPVLFSIKLTLPVLLATLVVFVLRTKSFVTNPALALAAVLIVFSITCRVQIGIRLQFPAIALLIVGLAASLATLRARHLCWYGVGGIASAALAAWPHGLTYVNTLWGGAEHGYRLVSDSNYDWGQGVPELDAWHEGSGRVGLDVWYFGQDPALKRMPVRDLPLHCVTLNKPDDVKTFCWGRHLAVSTTLLYGWPLSPAHRQAVAFLQTRKPAARTATFLIYDFTDIGPPESTP